MMQRLYIHAPAKINLTLDVLAKRPDGYHELATTMHQIDWVDTVSLEKMCGEIHLEHDHGGLPTGKGNLAFQAAQAVREFTGLTDGVRVFIRKRIPVEAGLAGGSTDAAAVIRGMNTLFALQLTEAEMCRIGEGLGSDVPFCIKGGTAFCTGRGECMQALPDEKLGLLFVVVKPKFSLSTEQVFASFDMAKVERRPKEDSFQGAWRRGDLSALLPVMANVLETVSTGLHPEIAAVKRELLSLGANFAMMSGSGPTVFGLFLDAHAASKAVRVLKSRYAAVRMCRSFFRARQDA